MRYTLSASEGEFIYTYTCFGYLSPALIGGEFYNLKIVQVASKFEN